MYLKMIVQFLPHTSLKLINRSFQVSIDKTSQNQTYPADCRKVAAVESHNQD